MINSLISHYRTIISVFKNLIPLNFSKVSNLSNSIQTLVVNESFKLGCRPINLPNQHVKIPQFIVLTSNFMTCKSIHTLAMNNQGLLKSVSQPSTSQKHSIQGSLSIRGIVREHFPRPSEIKRIKKHGWKKRMSTKAGREIIMRRILKGRHCLTH